MKVSSSRRWIRQAGFLRWWRFFLHRGELGPGSTALALALLAPELSDLLTLWGFNT
jgi:hypothetical protein